MDQKSNNISKKKYHALIFICAALILIGAGYVTYRSGFFEVSTQDRPIQAAPKDCRLVAEEETSPLENIKPGCFDYYTYKLTWPSELCSADEATMTTQRDGICNPFGYFHNKIAPLNLQPTFAPNAAGQVRYPAGCKDKYSNKLSGGVDYSDLDPELISLVKELSGRDFIDYLREIWEGPGACSGFSPNIYFHLVFFRLYEQLNLATLLTEQAGSKINYQEITDHFQGRQVVARCQVVRRKQFLLGIDLFVSKLHLGALIDRPENLQVENECNPNKPIYIRNIDSLYD